MSTIAIQKKKGRDLLRAVNLRMLESSYRKGRSLSVHLELFDPSNDPAYKGEGSDAFQRLLQSNGIITRSIPGLGLGADTGDTLLKKCRALTGNDEAGHVLFCEYVTRQWKSVALHTPYSTRALYGAADYAPGTTLNPYVNAPMAWDKQIAPQIPIDMLVAMTTTIDSDTYRAFYLTDDPVNSRFARVTEAAEIPGAKLTGGEQLIQLYKYGRKLKISYEAMRRMPLDELSLHVQRMAVQAEVDKLSVLMDIIVNGDGNSGTAATVYNLTTLDPLATANIPTITAWLTFKAKFRNPYNMDVVLGQEAPIIKLQLLNLGSANIPLYTAPAGLFGNLRPINNQLSTGQAFGISDDAPAASWLGFDTRLTVQHVLEAGATVQEVQRFITNQTEELTMTETEGWRRIDKQAAKIVNLAA